VLVDVAEGIPQGKALDLAQSGPVYGYDTQMIGTNGYDEVAGAELVVITAGIARKPGMSRDDLLETNAKIIRSVSQEIKRVAPDSIVIGNTVQSINNTSYGILCSDNPCTMRDNQLLGTFTAGKAYVGFRGVVSTGIVLNQDRIEMNGPLGTITIWDTTTPATGYWIQGDMVYDTAPSASGYIGWVCTTTPSTWKTWGAISA
jgi:hypothetical protein